mmetsp:Transcript_14435/g.37313  ORF Transcript_14435/g.37313 Transcript_14435/m.37313 type:complete len:271 (-) Transcript_14435:257-1069(-)
MKPITSQCLCNLRRHLGGLHKAGQVSTAHELEFLECDGIDPAPDDVPEHAEDGRCVPKQDAAEAPGVVAPQNRDHEFRDLVVNAFCAEAGQVENHAHLLKALGLRLADCHLQIVQDHLDAFVEVPRGPAVPPSGGPQDRLSNPVEAVHVAFAYRQFALHLLEGDVPWPHLLAPRGVLPQRGGGLVSIALACSQEAAAGRLVNREPWAVPGRRCGTPSLQGGCGLIAASLNNGHGCRRLGLLVNFRHPLQPPRQALQGQEEDQQNHEEDRI